MFKLVFFCFLFFIIVVGKKRGRCVDVVFDTKVKDLPVYNQFGKIAEKFSDLLYRDKDERIKWADAPVYDVWGNEVTDKFSDLTDIDVPDDVAEEEFEKVYGDKWEC